MEKSLLQGDTDLLAISEQVNNRCLAKQKDPLSIFGYWKHLFIKGFRIFIYSSLVKEKLWRLYIKLFRKQDSVSLDLDRTKTEIKLR